MFIKGEEEYGDTIICNCGSKTIKEAMNIFQNTSMPYKKAKKLVTGCDKSCCRKALMLLFDMTYYGEIDMKEVAELIY